MIAPHRKWLTGGDQLSTQKSTFLIIAYHRKWMTGGNLNYP